MRNNKKEIKEVRDIKRIKNKKFVMNLKKKKNK